MSTIFLSEYNHVFIFAPFQYGVLLKLSIIFNPNGVSNHAFLFALSGCEMEIISK